MTLTKTHIDDLLALCLKGNQFAQMEIYNRYYRAMYNTALRIVKQTDEAEDIMQEAFLTAFQKLHTFRGEASFGTWLKRIVVNKSVSMSKKMEENEAIEEYKMTDFAEESFEDVQENYSQLKATEVLQTINDMKSNYSTILTLHYIEGYDYEEIAQIMNLSYANSRTMLSRARESLRKKLAEVKI